MQLLLGRLLEHGSAEKEIYSMFRDPYGIHCLIPMLLLQVPILYMNVYRASLGQRFCEDRIVGPPTAKCGLCRITSMYMYMYMYMHVYVPAKFAGKRARSRVRGEGQPRARARSPG